MVTKLKTSFSPVSILLVLILFIGAGAGTLMWYLSDLTTNFVKVSALENAAKVSSMLAEFRTLYTSEVVERVRPLGIEVTHDYQKNPQAIPLPATFSMELGRRLGEKNIGLETRLYSDFPFPWRQDSGSNDDFEKQALAYLGKNPNQPFYRFENFKGEPTLRYVTADRMRHSCVACHNSHPDSPKKDWKVGDVRGGLEVIIPLKAAKAQIKEGLKGTIFLVSSFAVLTLLGFILVIWMIRKSLNIERHAQDLALEIAERKRMEQRLLQSEKMAAVGQLAAGVAHEINNPLGVILGFAQSVVKRLPSGDSMELPLKSIEREAVRCKNLVQDLLTFSRVEKGEKGPVDLKEAIEAALSLVLAQTKVKNTELVKEFYEVPEALGNKNQIQQIVVNLCNNAMDAMPTGGKLTIRLQKSKRENKDMAEIQIQDTGQGIPEEIRDKIFNPFFTTKEVGKGTGLGLSLVYEIVQKHNGQIVLTSEIGQGSTFQVFLPLSVKQV